MAPNRVMQKCKKGERQQQPRAYWHEVIVYPEDTDAERIKADAADRWSEWVAILHDRDTNPKTGEIKRPHIHLLLHSENARTPSAVARELRIAPNMVEVKSNGQAAMAYLTHSTERARMDGKAVYAVTELEGPLAEQAAAAAERARGASSEAAQVVAILEQLQLTPGDEEIRMAEMAEWAARNGLWSAFRRAAVIFKSIIDEHNAEARQRRARSQESASRYVEDPLRFAKIKAGIIPESNASVDLSLIKEAFVK